MTLLKEFRPTILFLVKFVGIYLTCNVVYGLFVTSYHPRPDPVTGIVTQHTSAFLSAFGWPNTYGISSDGPTTYIETGGQRIIEVYEGCNGVNVVVVFIAFLIALGPYIRAMWWFIGGGVVLIHLANLIRVGMLYVVALSLPQYFFLTHKYFFTASIYLVVFASWLVWVKVFSRSRV